MITAKQIRAARAALGWYQKDLAEATNGALSAETVRRIETQNALGTLRAATYEALVKTLENAGVKFLNTQDAEGVVWKKDT